jgi:DNA polymerase-3 subunit alpha
MSARADFVHLRVHSEYSLIDSVLSVSSLMTGVPQLDMASIGLTDQGNIFAAVKFYRAALKAGIKPIIGVDFWIAATLEDRDPSRLTMLCMDASGFHQLSRLLTLSFSQGQYLGRALLLKEWLHADDLTGLLALSGGQYGELGQILLGSQPERAVEALRYWRTLFPERYYIEVQRVGRPQEHAYLPKATNLAAREGVPLVATNDVRFLTRQDFEAHETRVCIQQGRILDEPGRPRDYTEQQYLKCPEEMAALFPDLPEALANSVEIAKRCNFQMDLGNVCLPEFELPQEMTAVTYLREKAHGRLRTRLPQLISAEREPAQYTARLDRELNVICEMGFEGYFLIVADFIDWARNNRIPVGPGRGSGAGSLVAFMLGITDIDPIKYELLFERFLNPERISMPDFDIDFCIEGRDRVIDYVTQRYGSDRVSQIITFGSMAAKAVVRDVGRVLGMPYGYVDRIAKLVPFQLGITLEKALVESDELKNAYETEDEVRTLIDVARPLEGLVRNAGTHAGGVVIAPSDLTDFMPLYCEPDGGTLTQFDKDDVESIGLVKFDFLGLKTLTIIDRAVKSINLDRSQENLDPVLIDEIPLDDPTTYELLKSCQTTAVFQLESYGMRDLIKRLQPDHFDDLVAILALFRPGPLQSGMVEDFISRKHGHNSKPIDYFHPTLEPILKSTYGVILYQEQVMQIAQIMAGYSLGGADLLRRAMGKKKPEEMAQQRSIFLEGSGKKGMDERMSSYVFDLMEKFAGYGFNKSHSVAYALVAFQTAWLKARHPEAFMSAVLTADMDNTDKLVLLKDDCSQMGITLLQPDVNASAYEFTVGNSNSIKYGLGAIKGVGRAVIGGIVGAREMGGRFRNLLDFCRRVDQHKLNRRVLEALSRSGALDGLGANRATLFNAVPNALRLAKHAAHATAAGQTALFEDQDGDDGLESLFTPVREWNERERLAAERESLGLFLSGHPFDQYADHCRYFTNGSILKVVGSLPADGGQFRARRDVVIAGLVTEISRRGNRVSVRLDDNSDRAEVTLCDEAYTEFGHLLAKDTVLVVEGQLRYDNFLNLWCITAKTIRSVDEAIEENARRLTICWNSAEEGAEFIRSLRDTLRPFTQGQCEVCVEYEGPAASASLTFGDGWTVRPTRELRERLTQLVGDERYSIHYPRHPN